MGVELIPRTYQNKLPTLLLSYAGHHNNMFSNEHGEIINGFMLGIPSHPIWLVVWLIMINMINDYPSS